MLHRRGAATTVAALLGLGALAGCLPDPRRQPGQASAEGSWQFTPTQGCTQQLSLDAAGRFSFAAWVGLGTLGAVEQVEGSLTPPSAVTSGQSAVRFVPDAAAGGSSRVYCDQWDPVPPALLPFAVAEAALGIDPRSLVYTPGLGPDGGLMLTGTDANRRDQLVLYVSAQQRLVAIRAADPGAFPNGIFRALPDDPAPPPTIDLKVRPVLTLPDRYWARRYTGTTSGQPVDEIVLNVAAGSDVTFSGIPGSSTPACSFVLHDDLNFTNPIAVNQLDPLAASQTRTFNPAGPGWPFPASIGGVTAYLVPVAVVPPGDGACEAVIRAQAISERIAAVHAATPGSPALFSVALPAQEAYLLGHRPGLSQRLEHIFLSGARLQSGPVLLTGSLVSPAGVPGEGESTPLQDPLRLAGPTGATAFLSVSRGAGAATLNIFPSAEARTGFGPFHPGVGPAGEVLGIPDQRVTTAPYDGYRADYRLHVTAPERVALWTAGGIGTSGHLLDGAGRTVAVSRGGAADGVGFRIETDLAPGDYGLRITAAAGTFTLSTDAGMEPSPFTDPGLHACLVESGWAQYPVAPVRAAWCARRGIQSVDGVELVATLRTLDLTGNGLRRIDALRDSWQTETLLLGGNPLEDIAPLAGMSGLRRLSLADTRLTSGDLAVLEGLSGQLTVLDLSGVATLSDDPLSSLRSALPFTTIIAPDGRLLP